MITDLQRTFLREITDNKALQIQAIGLSLYEPVEGIAEEKIGEQVIRTQWLYEHRFSCAARLLISDSLNRGSDAGKLLVGKRVLIVVSDLLLKLCERTE